MNKLFRIRAIQLCLVLVVSCLCVSCSHLNVDFDSSWSARNISVVVVEHELAPDDVTTADIVNILTRSGWHVVADREQAQARVVCRWARQPDLTEDSEPIEVVKSFHVQVISIQQPKILAVSDYFYSDVTEELIAGVNAALTALTHVPAAPEPQPALQVTQPAVSQSPIATAKVAVPAVKENPVKRIPTQTTTGAQDFSETQPVESLQNNADPIVVEEVAAVSIEESPQLVHPMEPAVPTKQVQPMEPAEPVSMEKSPWVPRFQGMGLDEWGKQ